MVNFNITKSAALLKVSNPCSLEFRIKCNTEKEKLYIKLFLLKLMWKNTSNGNDRGCISVHQISVAVFFFLHMFLLNGSLSFSLFANCGTAAAFCQHRTFFRVYRVTQFGMLLFFFIANSDFRTYSKRARVRCQCFSHLFTLLLSSVLSQDL